MRRLFIAAAGVAAILALAGPAATHDFDHPAPLFSPTAPPTGTVLMEPLGAWQHIATIASGNPHTDIDFFTQNGEIYMSAGTLATGTPNNDGGQTIVKLTQNGEVTAAGIQFVSSHPSANCLADSSAALGLQHDIEATPKGDVIFNTTFPPGVNPVTADAQLLLDSTDAEGRCHDAATAGLGGPESDPQGGLEIIDITDIDNPKEIGLTSHIGEAHTVNVDPKRPHIAFAVTSDSVTAACNANDTACTRANENPASTARFNLDGFELVDLSTCMNFEPLTSTEVKRMTCRPEVYRYRYPTAVMALGHSVDAVAGCHELEIYPDDRLTCAGIHASLVFDLKGAFDTRGTASPLDDRPKGTPLPCRVRPSMTPPPVFDTEALVTDCVYDEGGQELTIPRWLQIGAPSLQGVKFVGAAYHQGRGGPNPATEDIDVSHEAELSGSRRLVLATDERGGGVTPPGATCVTSPADNPQGNGGIHAYRVDRLLSKTPTGPESPQRAEEAWTSYARTPSGEKAIYRAPIVTGPQASLCTSHVFHQIPGQNRIFMGWYTQGTQVVDLVERADGTVEFQKVGHFIPPNANTWTSAVFKMQDNGDGTFTYWGATGDFFLGAAGRSAIDVWKVTLPAPPTPFGQGGGGGAAGDRATGGGWLADNAGKKINFSLTARETASGVDGNLKLNDKPAGVKIDVKEITSLGAVDEPCGSVPEAPNSLQLRGTGKFNGANASFRACVQDNGEGAKASGADLFYLECTVGCTYSTGSRTPDDAIDGGNIQVRRSTAVASSGTATPATLILDPVLLTEGAAGQAQLFSVSVFDQNQERLAGAEIVLTRTAAGKTETMTALTDLTGTATVTVTNLTAAAEYVASAGDVQSNAVEVAPLLG